MHDFSGFGVNLQYEYLKNEIPEILRKYFSSMLQKNFLLKSCVQVFPRRLTCQSSLKTCTTRPWWRGGRRCWPATWITSGATRWPGWGWTRRLSWPSTTTSSPGTRESHCLTENTRSGSSTSPMSRRWTGAGTCARSTLTPWEAGEDIWRSRCPPALLIREAPMTWWWRRRIESILLVKQEDILSLRYCGGERMVNLSWPEAKKEVRIN